MSLFLAETAPGVHKLVSICGYGNVNLIVTKFYYCAFTPDTLISSAIAIVVTIAVGFAIAARLSHGVPGKLQMVFEFLLGFVRDQVAQTVEERATFVIPLAATIFFYILVANWLAFFPLPAQFGILPANADLNQTLAMAIVVFLLVEAYSIRVLGVGGFFRRFTKPFGMNWGIRGPYIAINVIEEIVKPVTLSLRLFGNIFAGVVMVYLLSTFSAFLAGLGGALKASSILGLGFLTAWKAFDVFFVGTIQAFIFMLLTIIYFGQAREGLEEEHH